MSLATIGFVSPVRPHTHIRLERKPRTEGVWSAQQTFVAGAPVTMTVNVGGDWLCRLVAIDAATGLESAPSAEIAVPYAPPASAPIAPDAPTGLSVAYS